MEFDIPKDTSSIIKVIGVGGGGSNAVNHMYNQGIIGVDFIVCNTDRQSLDISPVPCKIQLGTSLTEGLGAGAIPEIGMNAAIENIEEIKDILSRNTKMVFVTAGMGGGTGTGAAPIIAQTAREMGILTVGIVTVPFAFEGRKRRQQAEEGLERIRQNVDTLLVINNERLREISGNLTIGNAFAQADDVLTIAAKGIAEVISVTGSINVDFNDVRTAMKDSGHAIMGSATAEGDDRAINAVQKALSSPLLNDNDIHGAQYVLLNITYGDKEVLMDEISEITDYIQDEAGATADVIWGHGYDASLGNKIGITLIATGFSSSPITGFEKAPAKMVRPLEEEPKSEILRPLDSPTQANSYTPPSVTEELKADPFLKNEAVQNTAQTPVNQFIDSKPDQNLPLNETKKSDPYLKAGEPVTPHPTTQQYSWDFTNPETPTEPKNKTTEQPIKSEEKKVHVLDDETADKLNLDNVRTRTVLSPEEQQRKTQERMSKIEEYTIKLKRAEGITEFENEPAFVRRNIQLDQTPKSSQERVSRFGLTEGENGTNLRNNNFLHDNVD
jgi:cell division protein FtsZ